MSSPISAASIAGRLVANAPLEPTALYIVTRVHPWNAAPGQPFLVHWSIAYAKTDMYATLYSTNGGLLCTINAYIANDPGCWLLIRVCRPNWIHEASLARLFDDACQVSRRSYDPDPNNSGRTFVLTFLDVVMENHRGSVTSREALVTEMDNAIALAAAGRGGSVRHVTLISSCVRG